ncbi:MAG: UDP-glucose 4-epimerase GalE [Staphylococcus equorum]|uniref:UDP-glucose 4-epimerase GalE n=1 Tax=Tetragenococcus koreensis TaxID=290335 RepID=UPI001F1D98BF|nr:UDP-glucose 4-epimerase GalE [Tetragenococcus koreensis]MDN6570785.1 UDP-glucose 4-epimerase GalE [Staphylococcus equorum]MCF1617095.1 UDP-glucose 4-epimerase GalE [Tetragenococcus koreensis]MCF1621974.1 UDP-glucose 4-epimerase GalE [Tetragenococcus koreensis]MCF1641817.1 UDP-glucose 4-epimerase GalE [Tetragenococcus koreensis]MCF1678044.1 UDP-glucose 4-epimerase GalE [Tetragenococcus koreensis]
MAILVTGGLGYIGSHTVVELIENGYKVIIVDNYINSNSNILDQLFKITGVNPLFYKIDVTQKDKLEKVFVEQKIDEVIHFAGLKSIGESVEDPLRYYYNNVVSTMVISSLCIKYKVKKVVFSSSATVYGNQESPLKEETSLKKTTNPYGETKVMSERILTDVSYAHPEFSITLLRYFNPIGAHKSGLIGEKIKSSTNNLVPYISKVAKKEKSKVEIFGKDYNTIDGTGVRDYIHVVDLAKGHVKAVQSFKLGITTYNLGTGKGTSVLELIGAFEKVNNVSIPYEFVQRRLGDIEVSYADSSKAERELGWKTELSIKDMVKDAWNFEKKRRTY